MPGLARKVIICAAIDGLILQPLSSRKDQRPPGPPVRLKYGDASVSKVSRDISSDLSRPNASFESFGVVGLITVSPHSYLVSITRRQQVALIRGQPVYVVTEVALTPCASQVEAADAIARTAAHLRNKAAGPQESGDATGEETDTTDEEGDPPAPVTSDDVADQSEVDEAADGEKERAGRAPTTSSVVQDVIGKRGSYGRFAQRWFSRGGWMQDQRRNMGLSDAADPSSSSGGGGGGIGDDTPAVGPTESGEAGATAGPTTASLLPKLLRTAQILFGTSRSFYFSYDYDITRSVAAAADEVQRRGGSGAADKLPLHCKVDTTFFWNRNVQQRFMDAGADAFVLPLMQGFVGQRSFVVDSNPPQTDDAGAKDSLEMSNFAPAAAAAAAKSGSNAGSGTTSPQSESVSSGEGTRRLSERQFDITIISRRSVRRAGLRYLRRGIDEDGNAANFVETEQILSPSTTSAAAADMAAAAAGSSPSSSPPRTYSFVQIRGSIPLFFKQSPYSLKPSPVIQHSPEANFQALRRHFDMLGRHYGSLQVVNLLEKQGIEAPIGREYESSVGRLNEERRSDGRGRKEIPFEWFDFHHACRGMKFENVSLLLDILGKRIEGMGSAVATEESVSGGGGGSVPGLVLLSRQTGVLRTNCMDCLDRTNVCQSSFAKLMLDAQLREQGFDLSAQRDQENSWFNTVWADNGDSISKQYASTAAMKGDYTRTKKRDYRGALMDIGLSVTRLWSGMINDFFVQTTIDFLLGNVTSLVFEEFEVNMMTKDPAVSMQKMREQAIELCQKRVIADEGEEFIGGWTMLTPRAPDSLTTQPFEEAVLLLTDVAAYLCRFDWSLDKVSSFERVDLSHVTRIRFGTYVTSTVSAGQTDEAKNQGIVVFYRPGSDDVVRVNTRSMSSMLSGAGGGGGSGLAAAAQAEGRPSALAGILGRKPAPPAEKKMALKALYSQSSVADSNNRGGGSGDGGGGVVGAASITGGGGGGGSLLSSSSSRLTEVQQVVSITAQLERLVMLNQPVSAGTERKSIVEGGDIISLAEARRSTGLLDQLGYSIKRLVWA